MRGLRPILHGPSPHQRLRALSWQKPPIYSRGRRRERNRTAAVQAVSRLDQYRSDRTNATSFSTPRRGGLSVGVGGREDTAPSRIQRPASAW